MYSYLANVRETKAVLEQHGLVARHSLGQNFLVDDAVIGRILGLAELSRRDAVLEVGPGIGTLTVAMLPRAGAVVAVEADRSLPPVLAETCAQDSERLIVVEGDALRVTPEQLSEALAGITPTKCQAFLPGSSPNKLVSNLPYQVAATLILRVFRWMPSIGRAVVMVQREVADRICAEPGTREYGAYTAKLSTLCEVTGRFEVGRQSFVPSPHVESAVVRIDRAHEATDGLDLVWRVIDAAFAQRRKTVRNSLRAQGVPTDALDGALAEAGIDPRTRAERLSCKDFDTLARALMRAGAFEEERPA